MGDKTGISWTDATWNPIRGCSRVSEGCRNCYAEAVAARFSGKGLAYEGLTRNGKWTGEVRVIPEHLEDPLRWTRPRRIFVNSMSDLFHENLDDEVIDRIFAVMALAPQHTFQVLTKRPERMRAYFSDLRFRLSIIFEYALMLGKLNGYEIASRLDNPRPLDNVHLGVSVEDQPTAEERIPLLLQTPAAVRWVSYEPALGPVDFQSLDGIGGYRYNALCRGAPFGHYEYNAALDWLVIGGESGPGARPFDLAWARSTVAQCKAAGVSVFVKQLGARPFDLAGDGMLDSGEPPVGSYLDLSDRAGAEPSEWPEDLRIQEWPK